MRTTALALVVSLAAVATAWGMPKLAASGSTTSDAWGPAVTLRTPDGWYEAPIHASLLPDGRALMWGVARPTWPVSGPGPQRRAAWVLTPSPVDAALPAETTPPQLAEPVDIDGGTFNGLVVNDDLFCAGSTLTADGQVFIAGGARSFSTNGSPVVVLGLPYAATFDPGTTTITRVPGNMLVAGATGTTGRWYPTTTRLPDGRILVVGGFDRVIGGPTYNWSSEIYDPATGQRAVAAPFGILPAAVANRDYTHEWVLPYPNANNDLLMLGETDAPVLASTKALALFDTSPPLRPNASGLSTPGFGQSSTMLEVRASNGDWGYTNGSVLVTGGAMGSALMSRADVYDPIARAWRASVDTGTQRHHPATITLPDGRVLILTGHNLSGDAGVLGAQYIDPAHGYSLTTGTATMSQIRGYHTVALLLPDGRVLVGGGRDASTDTSVEKPTVQYYSPDYMTKTRPTIVGATTRIGFNQTFPIVTSGPSAKEAVLVALGSMTHSFDENQRVVQLPVGAVLPGSNGTTVMIVGGPPDAWTAPAGYYMLFVLDQNRVPSVAQIVHVG